jgi:hypothetical protein
MKRIIFVLTLLLFFSHEKLKAQGSVGYYPWSSLLSVSTNPEKAILAGCPFSDQFTFQQSERRHSPDI